MSPEELHHWLQARVKRPIALRINENKSTMVSVRWANPVRVSVHRMFLSAPDRALRDLAQYVGGRRKRLGPDAQRYMAEELPALSYRDRVLPERLAQRGHVYDLKEIYERLNREYFEGRLDLAITWYGRRACLSRSNSVTFGQYDDPLKLIKIHRILDDASFPPYFVEFVVYHEMVHHVCPPYVDKSGRNRVHSPEFKAQERLYRDFARAQGWINQHRDHLFGRIA